MFVYLRVVLDWDLYFEFGFARSGCVLEEGMEGKNLRATRAGLSLFR